MEKKEVSRFSYRSICLHLSFDLPFTKRGLTVMLIYAKYIKCRQNDVIGLNLCGQIVFNVGESTQIMKVKRL